MKRNITLEEAEKLLLARCVPTEKKNNDLSDALTRVLCQDIKALENIPPFSRSPYDGYALRAADTAGATQASPVVLEVIEEVPAGYAPQKRVAPGQATKILTGAPIPEGADCVIKYEETEICGNKVSLFSPLAPGENIVPAGEDIKCGELIASKGSVITAPLMGIMASLGVAVVPVYKRPKIAIVSTGDELVNITEPLTPGKIRNSNCYTLIGSLKAIGVQPVVIGTAGDRKEAVAPLLEEGLQRADMVITTGGVSVGDYDVVKEAVTLIDAETLYWKIEIKPGSSTLAAVKAGKLILGLSGNPAAAMVVFQLLAVPFIKKMAGRADYLNPKIEVTIKNDFKKASPRRRFLRGRLVLENGMAFMETTGNQGNGVLRSLVGCDLLAEIPAGSGPVKAGTKLTAYRID
jgi:molybdopterin molybdotransferase